MGRYSFFINGAVDVLAPSQFSSVRYVYAGDFDDGNSFDSVDGESVVDDNDDSDWEEKTGFENTDIEDFKLVEQEQEQEELPAESLIQPEAQAQTLQMTPFAFPTNNWGFNYQMDPGLFWISNYSDFQPKFRTLFMPNYNNFVDHVAGRINDINKNVAENTRVNAHLNARIDSTNSELYRLDGVNKGLINTVSKRAEFLNARIDSSNSEHGGLKKDINFLNSRIDSSNSEHGGLLKNINSNKTLIDDHFGYFQGRVNELWTPVTKNVADIKFLNSRIDSSNSEHGGLLKNINSNKTLIDNHFGYFQGRVNEVWEPVTKNVADIKFLNSRVDSTNSEVYRIDTKHTNSTKFLNERVDSTNDYSTWVNGKVDTDRAQLNALQTAFNSVDMFTELRRWFGVNDYSNNHGDADGAFTKLMKTQNKNLLAAIDSVSGKIKDYTTQFTVLNASTLLNGTKIDSFAKKNDENLTFLLAAIGTLKNYDDSSLKTSVNNVGSKIKDYTTQLNAIKTAVDSVKSNMKDYTGALNSISLSTVANGTKIDSFAKKNDENLTFLLAGIAGLKNYDDTSFQNQFKKTFQSYFTVESSNENGVQSGDGYFVKLIKGQFTRLIAELNRIFTLQINKFDQIKTAVTNLDQNLADQFELLFGWISLEIEWYTEMNKSLLAGVENQNFIAELIGLTNNWLSIIDGNIQTSLTYLETITNWLKQIYEKPVGGGNIINPAPEGTNFWDVLKSLVDGLAGIATAIIGLVDDLIDKLIKLIIPENTDFLSNGINDLKLKFEMKFESITDLGKSFSGLYSEPKNLANMEIEVFEQKFNILPSNLNGVLSTVRTLITGFMVLLTLSSAYKRIVGGGDVIQ